MDISNFNEEDQSNYMPVGDSEDNRDPTMDYHEERYQRIQSSME